MLAPPNPGGKRHQSRDVAEHHGGAGNGSSTRGHGRSLAVRRTPRGGFKQPGSEVRRRQNSNLAPMPAVRRSESNRAGGPGGSRTPKAFAAVLQTVGLATCPLPTQREMNLATGYRTRFPFGRLNP